MLNQWCAFDTFFLWHVHPHSRYPSSEQWLLEKAALERQCLCCSATTCSGHLSQQMTRVWTKKQQTWPFSLSNLAWGFQLCCGTEKDSGGPWTLRTRCLARRDLQRQAGVCYLDSTYHLGQQSKRNCDMVFKVRMIRTDLRRVALLDKTIGPSIPVSHRDQAGFSGKPTHSLMVLICLAQVPGGSQHSGPKESLELPLQVV